MNSQVNYLDFHSDAIANDTVKVDTLNQLALEIQRNKPKRSFELSEEAYGLAKKINYEVGVARSLLEMARCSWLIGDREKAIVYSLDSLEISKRINHEECQVGSLNVLGNIYAEFESFDKALEYYMPSLKVARKNQFRRQEAALLNNIGEIYKILEEYDTALQYYQESKDIYDLITDKRGSGVPVSNTGVVYYYLGLYEEAQQNLELSLKIFQETHDLIGQSDSLYQLARVYRKLNQNDKALDYYMRSLEIFEETGDRFHKIDILLDLHHILLEREDYDEAINHLEEALDLAQESNANILVAKTCSYMAAIYEKIGDYEKALCFYKKFHDTQSEADDYKLENKLKSVTTQFKMEQSQQEKEIYRLRNVELKQKTSELEKKTLELETLYKNITTISQMGQSITSTLDLEQILNTVYDNINSLMDANVFGIGLYEEENGQLKYELFIEKGKRLNLDYVTSIDDENSFAAWCVKHRKEVKINNIYNEYHHYIKHYENKSIGEHTKSIIYCPLIVEEMVIGMITVQSFKEDAYTDYNMDTIKALGSYIAIAIKNAQKSEKLNQEIRERQLIQKELEEANMKLLNISKLDGLTSIPNRRRFDEFLGEEWAKERRESNALSLVLIDIDHFKEYNDNYGHLAGDQCVIQVAQTLKASLKRITDLIARYGGDEFVAVLPNTDLQGAVSVAEAMREAIEQLKIEHAYSDVANYVTATFGVTTIVSDTDKTIQEFINSADRALYMAKEKGRNRVEAIF